jgi:glycosyltransferase involved in cell wall biosynthesis
MMRVGYDVSVLGLAHAEPVHRTGIFRWAEQVARGLARSAECELVFAAPGWLRNVNRSGDYLAAHPEFGGVPFAAPPLGPRLLRAADAAARRRGAPPRLMEGAAAWVERLFGRLNQGVPRGIDIFHSPVFALPPRRRRERGVRRFLSVPDLTTERFPGLFGWEVVADMRRVFASLHPGDWVLAPSECTRADLLAHRPDLDPSRVFVTPLAADPHVFRPVCDAARIAAARARYGIPAGPYLLAVNTLNPRKNMDGAIRAFARLVAQERVPGLSLVLVGQKVWDYQHITRALDQAGAARDRVVLAGYVADDDLAAVYSGAAAFVYPSLYEGFGLPPLEAMQCGLPVITSNTSSLPEVVGDAGVMVDPTDVEALADAMLVLYRDERLRAELRERSLRRAAGFTWEACVRRTLDAYRAALAS